MKINLDRLCKLAGVETAQEGTLNEASNRSLHDDPALSDEADYRFGQNQLAESDADDDGDDDDGEPPVEETLNEEDHDDDGDDGDDDELKSEYGEMDEYLDEVIEVDEAMLVQELRRARAMLSEAKAAEAEEHEGLTEAQLRDIVSEEVSNIMKDFNLTAGWVYGKDKPKNSKPGQVITSMPGLGFKSFDK